MLDFQELGLIHILTQIKILCQIGHFAVMNEFPNFNIVGEEWSDTPIVISYWQKDKINHDGYVSYLPTLMDFPLQISFAEAL